MATIKMEFDEAALTAFKILRYKYWLSGAEMRRTSLLPKIRRLAEEIGENEGALLDLFHNYLFECIDAGAIGRPLPRCPESEPHDWLIAYKIVRKTCFGNVDGLHKYVAKLCVASSLPFDRTAALAKAILLKHLDVEMDGVPDLIIKAESVTG